MLSKTRVGKLEHIALNTILYILRASLKPQCHTGCYKLKPFEVDWNHVRVYTFILPKTNQQAYKSLHLWPSMRLPTTPPETDMKPSDWGTTTSWTMKGIGSVMKGGGGGLELTQLPKRKSTPHIFNISSQQQNLNLSHITTNNGGLIYKA